MVNIRPLREAHGLSQAKLAAMVGVSKPAVFYWEKGTSSPSPENSCRLADIFGVTTDELLGRKPGA